MLARRSGRVRCVTGSSQRERRQVRDHELDQDATSQGPQPVATVSNFREAVLTLIQAYLRDESLTEVRGGKTNARIVAALVRRAADHASAITRIELPPQTAVSLVDLMAGRPIGAEPSTQGHSGRDHNLVVKALQRIYDRARPSVSHDGDALLLARSLVHLSGKLRQMSLTAAFDSAVVRVHTPIRVWVDVNPGDDADDLDLSYVRAKRGGWSLPQTDYLFATRKPLIQRIAAEARRGCRRIALWGLPGMGKTQAAVHLAAAVAGDTTDVVGFVAVRGHSSSPLRPDEMFHVARSRVSDAEPSRSMENKVADAESLFLRAVGSQQAVLVFDDVTIEHAAALSQVFTPDGLTIIITTRGEVPVRGFQWYELAGLDLGDATDFLAQTSGREFHDPETREIAARIVRQCCYVPLCISAVGAVLALEKTLRPEALAEELKSYADVLALQHPHENALLSAVFEASYRRLSPDAQVVFLRMSLFEGSFSREAEAVVCEDPHSRAARDVRLAGLLRIVHDGLYDLHDLVRAYAAWRYVDQTTPEQRCQDLSRVARYYIPLLEEAPRARWQSDARSALRHWGVTAARTVSRVARELFSGTCTLDEDTLLRYAIEIAAAPRELVMVPGLSSDTFAAAIAYCLDREDDPRLFRHLPVIYHVAMHERSSDQHSQSRPPAYWIEFAGKALEASERAEKSHWIKMSEDRLLEFCDGADNIPAAISSLRPVTQSPRPRPRFIEVLAELLLLLDRVDDATSVLTQLVSGEDGADAQNLVSFLRHPRQMALAAVTAAVRGTLETALEAARMAQAQLDQPSSYADEPSFQQAGNLAKMRTSLVALEARLLVAQGDVGAARRLLTRHSAADAAHVGAHGETARAMFEAGLMRDAERAATRQIESWGQGFRWQSSRASAYDVRAHVRKQTGDRIGSIEDAVKAAQLWRSLATPQLSWLTRPFNRQ